MGDEADSQEEYLNERFERTGVWANISNAVVHQDYIRWLVDEYYVMRPLSILMDEGIVKFDKDKIRKQKAEIGNKQKTLGGKG